MNERIRQLWDQAQEEIKAEYEDESSRNRRLYNEIFLPKFAELIVRECGQWFNDRLVVEPDYGLEHRVERNRAVIGVMKEFNQHFGVKE